VPLLEDQLVALQVDIEEHADRRKIRDHCRTAIRHERKWNAGDWHDANRHADVDGHVWRAFPSVGNTNLSH
jgi:hypothetical protein